MRMWAVEALTSCCFLLGGSISIHSWLHTGSFAYSPCLAQWSLSRCHSWHWDLISCRQSSWSETDIHCQLSKLICYRNIESTSDGSNDASRCELNALSSCGATSFNFLIFTLAIRHTMSINKKRLVSTRVFLVYTTMSGSWTPWQEATPSHTWAIHGSPIYLGWDSHD